MTACLILANLELPCRLLKETSSLVGLNCFTIHDTNAKALANEKPLSPIIERS